MKMSSLTIAALGSLVFCGATSANAAMPVLPLAGGDPAVILVDCAYGWYRGPDGQCYISGRGPRYYRGYERRGYYRHRDWHRGDEYGGDYRRPYSPVPYPFNGQPFGPQYDEY
jgi:hypothetical protein